MGRKGRAGSPLWVWLSAPLFVAVIVVGSLCMGEWFLIPVFAAIVIGVFYLIWSKDDADKWRLAEIRREVKLLRAQIVERQRHLRVSSTTRAAIEVQDSRLESLVNQLNRLVSESDDIYDRHPEWPPDRLSADLGQQV